MSADPEVPVEDVVRDFDPTTASTRDWRRFHRFRWLRAEVDELVVPPTTSDDIVELSMTVVDPIVDRRWAEVNVDGETVGALEARVLQVNDAARVLQADIFVLPDHRRLGFGSALACQAVGLARVLGCKVCELVTCDPAAVRLLERHGAVRVQRRAIMRLDRDSIDRALIDRWADASAHVRVDTYVGRLPVDVREDYCRICAIAGPEMPRAGRTLSLPTVTRDHLEARYRFYDASSSGHLVCLAYDAIGVVGVREVIWQEGDLCHLDSSFVGVAPRARRQGLSRALKAAMLLRLRRDWVGTNWIMFGDIPLGHVTVRDNLATGFVFHAPYDVYELSLTGGGEAA